MRAGSAQIRYSNNIESRNIWQRIIEMFSAWIFRLLFICVFLIFVVSFGIFYHQGCEGWTSRMPVPAKSRSVHRSCQYPHPLQTVRGHLQRTDDIHPDLQIPRILFLPGASARFPGLRKRRVGRKWRWQEDSILSYELPYGHKTRCQKPPERADQGFCQWQVFRFSFLRSGS